jgi:hypothetical protein
MHLADPALAACPAAAARSLQEFGHYLLLLAQQLETTGAAKDPQVAIAIQRLRQALQEGASVMGIRQVGGQAIARGTWGVGLGGRGRNAQQAGVACT